LQWATFIAACIAAVATGFYAYFSYRQWKATEAVAKDTARSANAANLAAETTERAMKTQGQPHVLIERIRLVDDEFNTPPNPVIKYRLKNYGQNPAWIQRHVMYFRKMAVLQEPPPWGLPDRLLGYAIPGGQYIATCSHFEGTLNDADWHNLLSRPLKKRV